MQSTAPNSDAALDDDAIKMLFKYANWDVIYEEQDDEWLVRPNEDNFYGYASFTTLQHAMEYYLHYIKLK